MFKHIAEFLIITCLVTMFVIGMAFAFWPAHMQHLDQTPSDIKYGGHEPPADICNDESCCTGSGCTERPQ